MAKVLAVSHFLHISPALATQAAQGLGSRRHVQAAAQPQPPARASAAAAAAAAASFVAKAMGGAAHSRSFSM